MGSRTETRRGTRCQAHHWVIDAPNGRESRGSCKHCGAKRAFANSTESVMWERGNTVRSELRITTKPQTVRLADDENYEE